MQGESENQFYMLLVLIIFLHYFVLCKTALEKQLSRHVSVIFLVAVSQ